jgi:eukaryotic-like serine/threonine-protein kinase
MELRRLVCPSCGAQARQVSTYCPECGAAVAVQPEVDEHVGRTVAKKFKIEQLIGEGGMGKVYRARVLTLDKPVVLKVLHRSLLCDQRTVARFHREAQAASRLSHPNSINVLDFGETESGEHYIAMELVDGKDLHQVLSSEWPLSEARVIRIASQVLAALSEAHSAGIIHRDLKPENIMVEQLRHEPDFVKVLDFGIAKIVDAAAEDGPLTRAGFVCGTPEFMSPEQARGGDLDARSDLYAVGVLLYQLTTGLLPFDADSSAAFAAKHLTEPPIPPSQRRPGVRISPGMEQLILRALSKDPAKRPQTADEFKAVLTALVEPAAMSPVESAAGLVADSERAQSSSVRSWRSFRRAWRLFQMATLVLLAAAIGLGYGLYRSSLRVKTQPTAWPANAPTPQQPTSARR